MIKFPSNPTSNPTHVRFTPAIKLKSTTVRRLIWLFCWTMLSMRVSSQTFFSKSSGDLNQLTTWGQNTDGSGSGPANFTSANCLYIITNRSSATIGAAWTVSGSNSKVQTGDGVTGTEFVIPSGSLFTGTVDVSTSATLTIQHGTSPVFGTLANGSTINYAGAANQNVRSANFHNLVLSGGGQKFMTNTFSSSVSNSLIINSGVLFRLHTVNTLTFTLGGTISGSGSLLGNANSVLLINGSGAAGSLTFSTNLNLYRLFLDRTSGGSVILGSNLIIGNELVHGNGTFDLNGKQLTLNGAVTFPASTGNGVLRGSATSTLIIATSTSAITNQILMDQTSSSTNDLARFTLNRSAQTLTLGNNLDITNAFTLSNGIIDLNGQALALNGILIFPLTALNGEFKGSSTSTLTIGGAGAITNALRLNQSTISNKSLHTFGINHTGGTLVFGTDIICDANFFHTNGPVTLGATRLTLNGAISFPVSASNGSVTGSATSSLVISGTGSISNSWFMSQSSASARTLNYFSVDRSGELFSLGNSMIVSTFDHISGIVSIGPALLTLNGSITFPATSADGMFRGSSTSSLAISASINTITNQLIMDQSTASHLSLNRFAFDRVTQTLTLGTDLLVAGAFVQTNGFIQLNDRSLTIGGIITFPSTALTGYFTGSPSSSLVINGNGVITNSLKLDQTNTNSRSLHSFIIDHTGGTLVFGTDITSTGQFSHINGPVTLGATSLTLNGAIILPLSASNGSLTGSASSSLSIGGSGTISNSLFMRQTTAAGRTINSFIFNRHGQSITIGNPLVVNSYEQTNGSVDLGGTLLTLSGAITFPASAVNGSITGSGSSSLTIGASTALLTNSLFMDQNNASARTLGRLTFNRAAQTLTLGNHLILLNGLTHTNGNINLNGNLLTIGGVITFPVAITNGYIIGSSTSSLTIDGSGTISNALRLDQSNANSRTISAFTIDHTGGTLILGNNIIAADIFTHNSGPVTLGATMLTLNGTIRFPLSAANGSLTGSATSSLLITGTGSIINSIYMSQSTAAARTLNHLTLNRSGETLSLGNALTVNTFSQSNGSVSLNGSLLTLSNAITFPASAGNGVMIGSLTSSVLINGAGAITNQLRMDQASQGSRSLYNLTMSRGSQTLSIGTPLEIRNAVTPSAGTIAGNNLITLKADAFRSAMVGVAGGALTGSLNVETFAPGSTTGWTHLGPSGVTGLTVANWEGQFFMTCMGCPNNEYSAGGYFVSIQRYNETGIGNAAYVPLSYTSALTRGLGYWVYLGTGSSTTSAITYSVSGPSVSGNVVIPVTNSNNGGSNLVSNPYPAPIDWDLVAADAANSNISGSISFYNPDIGQYISYAGGVSNPPGYISNGVIPMGQGFYVLANTNTSITFRESHKSNENTNANPLLRSQTHSPEKILRLTISGPDNSHDETTVRFHENATSQFDRLLDAKKIADVPAFPGTPSIYAHRTTISSMSDGNEYSINSLPASQSTNYIIPVLAKANKTGLCLISAYDIQNLAPETCVGLYDRVFDKEHDLRTGSYSCVIADSTTVPRFELRICSQESSVIQDQKNDPQQMMRIYKNNNDVVIRSTKKMAEKSVVSVFNTMGQKIMEDQEMNEELILSFHDSDQVIIVKVKNASGETIKKISL